MNFFEKVICGISGGEVCAGRKAGRNKAQDTWPFLVL